MASILGNFRIEGREFKVEGLKELKRKVNQLADPKDRHKVWNNATRAGAVQARKGADSRLPGHLASRSAEGSRLDVRKHRRLSRGMLIVYYVAPKKGHAGLRFIEYGTPPHTITARRKKALFLGGNAGRSGALLLDDDPVIKSVEHPGQQARPFLRPTLYQDQSLILDKYKRNVEKSLKRIWEKGGR